MIRNSTIHTSIVIPAFNEEVLLADCLRSIKAQHGALPYEVIVVDNASTDRTADIARRHGATVVREDRRGVCAARQAGLAAARGGIVVSTDADCTYPDGWLRTIQQTFDRQPDVSLLLGSYRFGGPADARQSDTGKTATATITLANHLLAAWEAMALRVYYAFGRNWYVSAANLAFRKADFGGYDPGLHQGGDELFVLRQLKSRGRVLFRTTRPVTTSARRLRQGIIRTFVVDFLGRYLAEYGLALRLGRSPFGSYAAHRDGAADDRRGDRFVATGMAALLAMLVVAMVTVGLWRLLAGHAGPWHIIGWLALNLGVVAYAVCWPTSQLLLPAPFGVRTSRKVIALTFDDGPNGNYTRDIAAIIESYGGRATFFQCGQSIERFPELTRQLAATGHIIANHTYSHRWSVVWRPRLLDHELAVTNRLIRQYTGSDPSYFRSPWLIKHPWLKRTLTRHGLSAVGGRLAARLEFRQPEPQAMAAEALRKARPGGILVFHDSRETSGGDRSRTLEAVRIVCQRLHEDNYQLVTLDELL